MKRLLSLLIILILVCGCADVKEIDSKKTDINAVIEKNNYIIVDVRTKEEYDTGHVIDAINIPYDEINGDTDLDITKDILVYCQSGKRSNIAFNTLKDLGYKVYDLGAYNTVNLPKN